MKKEILILGIIFLFVGVGIQPAFAVEITNDIKSDNIEDCNFEVDDSYDIEKIERLLNRAERSLNRVETLTKLIPILSKENPEVKEDCIKLSDEINTFREMNEELKSALSDQDNDIICIILFLTGIAISIIYNFKSLLVFLLYIIFQNIPIIVDFIVQLDEFLLTNLLRKINLIVDLLIFFDCRIPPTGITKELNQKIL